MLLDGSRIKQLAVDNALPKSTAYEYLWKGLEALATCAPTLHDAIDAIRGVGNIHIGLDGTLIPHQPSPHRRPHRELRPVLLGKAEEHLLVLVDLGYEQFRDFPAVRAPHKKPKHGELTETQRSYNRLHGALRALAEKANADLKVRFACLDKVSLNPWRIGTIARACLAFFRIERPRRPKNITQSA